jgi:hypothetical protein
MMSFVARKISHHGAIPAAFSVALIIGGVISLLLGQDANWDLKNYHIHNPWALLNNRAGSDIFTAGIQTYFNPLLDLPYYFLAIEWFPSSPRLVAFLMGFPAGVLLFFVWLCASEVLRAFKVDKYSVFLMTGIVVAIGMTGAATVSQWGATFNEIQVAAIVVAGIYIIIAKIDIDKPSFKWIMSSGVCFGVAAGLKLTAAIYAPGAFLAIAIISGNLKIGIRRIVCFPIGWAVGFLLFYGWWGYHLYELTGSPIFPWFNNLFESPWVSSAILMDNRFKPNGFVETLFYPFHWLSPKPMVVAEPIFADPRFSLAYLSFLMVGLAYIFHCSGKGLKSINTFNGAGMPRQAATLMIWLVVSYVLWQLMSSILRYAVPIEVFTGLMILIGLLVIARLLNAFNYSLWVILMLLVICWLCATYTQYPEWGRVGYGKQVINVDKVDFPENSLIIFNGPPIAYLAPFLSRNNTGVSFIGVTDELLSNRNFFLWKKVTERIREQAGGIYMVERPEQQHMRNYLPEFGLRVNQASCREYRSTIDQPFTVCELQKISE